ncbi:MAG: 3-phosphoshikimate 1-carboxyvinyltransferase [Patescibacteria group bacterium]|nr:3-phosphoshikimate 1-carboxyvinyltransferase [Patescibacteria group bacterium]
MKLRVRPINNINGEVVAPGSKSQTVRAILLAALAEGDSVITNALDSEDSAAAIAVAKALGAQVDSRTGGNQPLIKMKGANVPFKHVSSLIYTSNSGIATNFSLPLLGLRTDCSKEITFDCGEQMRRRPITAMIAAARKLGMAISGQNGENFPLKVSGELIGGKAEIDGEISQTLSGLMIALPLAREDSILTINNLRERPYAKLTACWLDKLGIKYGWRQEKNIDIIDLPGRQKYRAFAAAVPGDFSSASYLIAAGALFPGRTIIKGLEANDVQGDKQLIPILTKMGADIFWQDNQLVINGGRPLAGFTIDCADIPDLLPTLAVIGTYAKGMTRLINAKVRSKETDRIASMKNGLRKMGADIEEIDDGLAIKQSSLAGTEVNGCDDHRTVMALALAGLLAAGETTITTAEAIKKTFPAFVETMNSLGAAIKKY